MTAFQAFHWFDRAQALSEIARLLRPGGRLAVVYNERAEGDAFTAAYGGLVERYATDDTEWRRSDGRAAIAALRSDPAWCGFMVTTVCNAQTLQRAALHARARSTSYLPAEGANADALHADIDALYEQYAGAGAVTMHMNTIVSLAQRVR